MQATSESLLSRTLPVAVLALLLSACATGDYLDFSGEGLQVVASKGGTCSDPDTTIYLVEASPGVYMHLSTSHYPSLKLLDARLFVSSRAETPFRFTSPDITVVTMNDNKSYTLPLPPFHSWDSALHSTLVLPDGPLSGVRQYWADLGLITIPSAHHVSIRFPPLEVGDQLITIPPIDAVRKSRAYVTAPCMR